MKISKIVITGGPHADKANAMTWIKDAFEQLGYAVLFVPGAADELISSGTMPQICKSNVEFQECVIKLQIANEKAFEKSAQIMKAEKILIVCDRGAIDNKAFMSETEFVEVLQHVNLNEVELRDSYDAVFHLVTPAKNCDVRGSLEAKDREEAIALDNRIISAWTGHPHFRIIGTASSSEEKMGRLVSEIMAFLGEPEPYEIERKYLIEYPNIAWLENNSFCQRVEIVQTYLDNRQGEEIRIRQRGIDGNYVYFQTIKREVSGAKRIEIEKRLSKEEYLNLLIASNANKRQIIKTRYCLVYENQYFEIDVYPFWEDKAILEIELIDENAEVIFPEEIKVIKEVTGDKAYKNSSLANIMKN